ncbi:MAG TPA: PEP/pyruvate-binding domain-containing protein [Anaerolineae bacterium]
MIRSFLELNSEQQRQAGGKGGVLARLRQRGYPVPDGFVILPTAFAGDELLPEARAQAQTYLAHLRRAQKDIAFAVRSSALSEDSAQASFAGEFDTVLDVRTDDEVCRAIATVRRSRHSDRARAYSQAQGQSGEHEMAVIVQELVRPEFAGVVFTADPVTGNLMQMTGNFVRGLGDALVSGKANSQTFTLHRPGGRYDGPIELKRSARRLYQLAGRLESDLKGPQDIEWAIFRGKVYILQSRPITTMQAFNPVTGEWNDSLAGDFLWSNGNAAEIQPGVMTLLSWSVGMLWGVGYSTGRMLGYRVGANIGGRSYFNLTVQVTPFVILPGMNAEKVLRYIGSWWGRVPEGVVCPLAPATFRQQLVEVLAFYQSLRKMIQWRARIPEFVREAPAWCGQMCQRIQEINDCKTLADFWRNELKPYYGFGTTMTGAANENSQVQLQREIQKMVGEEDAGALISNLGGQSYLESLGPVVGLNRVVRGELSREAYLKQYGHRSPYEFELSHPRLTEDPAAFDQLLTDCARHPVDVEALLEKQRRNFNAAWSRLVARYPRKAPAIHKRLERAAHLTQQREVARSELTRVMGVIRAFALRAGELTGLGEDVFHLMMDELLAVLDGDTAICRFLPARKETYARYCSLPPYPPVISGRFDPFQWAADPKRRNDVYDAHVSLPPTSSNVIQGFAGAMGVVEGVVRRLDRAEDGHLLQPGEILLTVTTNVGWTPLFPRAAAIVTDVGAPLSHAAIVARELGIPAVVGCGDATLRLKTGDRVRVDGGHGTVELLPT